MSDCQGTKDDLVEQVAGCICDKPHGVSVDNCLKQNRSPICLMYGKCRIQEKTKEQLSYILSSLNEKIFLDACPGSGKTEVVGLKAAYETKKWKSRYTGIAFLTFTNSAASVIRERVIQLTGVDGVTYPHYIGTIDSWFHRYIAHPFGNRVTGYTGQTGDYSIRIIESSSRAGLLNNFTTKYTINKRKYAANKYFYELDGEGFWYRQANNELAKFDNLKDWEEKDLRDTKSKFLKYGFATYEDIYYICNEVLKVAQLVKLLASRFPHIIVDECQDLTLNQLKLIERLISAGVFVHFVGDLQQSIFEFAGAYQGAIKNFIKKENFSQLPLKGNFRSSQPIVDVCDKLVNIKGTIGRGEKKGREPICIYSQYTDKKGMANLPDRFYKFLSSPTYNYINVEKTAILARGYSAIGMIRSCGDSSKSINYYPPLTINIWRTRNRSIEQTEEAISLMGKFILRKVFSSEIPQTKRYYCPESVSSPIQWRLYLAHVLSKCCNDKKMVDFQQTWSIWTKYFDDNFMNILRTEAKAFDMIAVPSVTKKILKSPSGEATKMVSACIQSHIGKSTNKMRITTFHKIKGETLNAVLVVSNPTAQGGGEGHWLKWLEDPNSENARFAYVASSRPKYLLAWALPKQSLNEENERKLAELGFEKSKM